jgi:hypothetical protein
MKGDSGDVQFIGLATAVQGFDVLQDMVVFMTAEIHQILGHGIEHEGIVGIRGMTKEKFHAGIPSSLKAIGYSLQEFRA